MSARGPLSERTCNPWGGADGNSGSGFKLTRKKARRAAGGRAERTGRVPAALCRVRAAQGAREAWVQEPLDLLPEETRARRGDEFPADSCRSFVAEISLRGGLPSRRKALRDAAR